MRDDGVAYVVAVLDRTTLGVSGLDAADRFGASPGVLSTFVVLQVIVYACAQVPAGLPARPIRFQGADPRGRRPDGVGPAGGRVYRVAARGDRGALGARPRRRVDVHLRAPTGASLVLVSAGSPRDTADRNLRAAGPGAVGRSVLQPAHRCGLDRRVRVGRGDRGAVDDADPRVGQEHTERSNGANADHIDPGDVGQCQDGVAAPGDATRLLHPYGHPILRHGVRVDV